MGLPSVKMPFTVDPRLSSRSGMRGLVPRMPGDHKIGFGQDRIARSGVSRIGQESVATGWPAGVRRSGIEIVTATGHVGLGLPKSGQPVAGIAALLRLAILFMIQCSQTGLPSKG